MVDPTELAQEQLVAPGFNWPVFNVFNWHRLCPPSKPDAAIVPELGTRAGAEPNTGDHQAVGLPDRE